MQQTKTQAAAIKSGQAPLINYMELTTTPQTPNPEDKEPVPQLPEEPKPNLGIALKDQRSPRYVCVVCNKPGTKFYKTMANGDRVLYYEHTDDKDSYRAPSGRLMGKRCRAGVILQDTSGLTKAMGIVGAAKISTNTKVKGGGKWPIGYCDGCKRDGLPLRYKSKVIKKGKLCVTCYAKEHKNLKGQKQRKDTNDPLNKTAKEKTGPKVKRGRGRPRADYKARYFALKSKWERAARLFAKPS